MQHETSAEPESDPPESRTITTLLSDTLRTLGLLLRSELNLAKAEIRQDIDRTKVALGLLVIAVVFAVTAFLLLASALVFALSALGLGHGWAAFAVGSTLAVPAFFLARKGLQVLNASSLTPERTTKNLKRDARVIKEIYDD